MKRLILIMLLVGIFFLTYGVSYIGLRASHRIVHNSNANHPIPDKRSAGHSVSTKHNSDRLIDLTFKPLMLVEEAFHHARGWMRFTDPA